MPVSTFLRYDIDLKRLTDAMFGFITDPHPTRNERPVVKALDDFHPESVEVMESMLLDGTEEREDVAAYVTAVFGGGKLEAGGGRPAPQSAGSDSLMRKEST